MVTIYLVRHCAAEGNVDGTYQGRYDSNITELGQKQLELVAMRLRNVPFTAIYTSPLKRARATAEAINQYHHVPLIAEESLIEINVGKMEGMKWAEFPKRYPKEADAWYHHLCDFTAPDGESIRQVADRVWNGVRAVVKKENVPGKEKVLCMTTHGCALRCFFCRAFGWPLDRIDEVPVSDNTGISEVRFADDGTCQVVRIGDASHLTKALSVQKNVKWGRA
ncbi:MAG: histidine phosphatase family protein [Oscillospiraceae bacterium]|jgi:broad specificity phosphatase PhoE|nr:histidine phosphatase family protein [Oscillospiraceae bacterium]HCA71195.1 histidine phosphatase family protein [Oscillospiraceae bacterium]